MSFSMYTIIPMPQIWEEKSFPYILVNLPIVGAFIGLLWYGLALLIINFNLPIGISSAITMIFPFIITGFIHMDGYMDTCDAIFSRASLEKKREILKDSRVGAFAVIAALVLFLLSYVSMLELFKEDNHYLKALIFIPVFSRCITILFIMKTNLISEKGFIATFKKDMTTNHLFIVFLIFLISIISCYIVGGFFLLFISFLNILIAILVSFYCTKNLNGISGDLCGFIITTTSMITLVFLAII